MFGGGPEASGALVQRLSGLGGSVELLIMLIRGRQAIVGVRGRLPGDGEQHLLEVGDAVLHPGEVLAELPEALSQQLQFGHLPPGVRCGRAYSPKHQKTSRSPGRHTPLATLREEDAKRLQTDWSQARQSTARVSPYERACGRARRGVRAVVCHAAEPRRMPELWRMGCGGGKDADWSRGSSGSGTGERRGDS